MDSCVTSLMATQEYAQAFGACLMAPQDSDSNTNHAHKRLQTLALEWKQLMVSLAINMPARITELRKQDGTVYNDSTWGLHSSRDPQPAGTLDACAKLMVNSSSPLCTHCNARHAMTVSTCKCYIYTLG